MQIYEHSAQFKPVMELKNVSVYCIIFKPVQTEIAYLQILHFFTQTAGLHRII